MKPNRNGPARGRTSIKDPLIIGVIYGRLFLIDQYDITKLERYVVTIPSPKGRGFCLTSMREELDNVIGNSGRVTDGWCSSSPDPTCGDVRGSIGVRVHHSAGCAGKRLSVSKAKSSALVAGHARPERVHELRFEPRTNGLVLMERVRQMQAEFAACLRDFYARAST